jgi:hypothetical protein
MIGVFPASASAMFLLCMVARRFSP